MPLPKAQPFLHLIRPILRLLCLFVAIQCLHAEPAPKLPVEDFFRPAACSQVELSPDGSKAAFVLADGWDQKLAVQDLKTGKLVRMAFDRKLELGEFQWKGNDQLLVRLQRDGYGTGEIFIAAADGSGTRALAAPGNELFDILDLLPDDPKHILITDQRAQTGISDLRGPSVHTLNVSSGSSQMVQPALERVYEWLTDQEGVVRLGQRYDADGSTWLHRREKGAPLTPLWKAKLVGDATFRPLAFDFDGRTLYVASNRNRDTDALWAFDVEKQEFVREIFAPPGVDVGEVLISRGRRRPMAVTYDSDRHQIHALDPGFASLQAGVQDNFPGLSADFLGFDAGWHRAMVLTHSDRYPGGYYVFDLDRGVLDGFRQVMPWIRTNQAAEMRPVEFNARDGLRIHAYLSLPAGREPRGLPLILLPHGGPQARDYWGFRREVQFLCNRGFAVLQVNFRGSTGYGQKFMEAGFGEWGGKMQDDLTDAVKWAVAGGYADPKRVGIYGASYGGYATMIGLCLTPELYRCGVNYVGVTDPKLLLKSVRNASDHVKAQVHLLLGGSVDADIKAPSPVALADKIQAPVLMYYGIYDPIVNVEQGDAMAAALSRAHKTYEYKTKTKEAHGFQSKEAKLEFYNALDEFLAKNLGE